MTAKEKAHKLVCNMYGCEDDTDLHDIYILNGDGYFLAKDCAIIAVDLVLNTNDIDAEYSYYKEVYQELEKL